MATKNFFITGVSSGFDLALAREALTRFDTVSPRRAFGKVLDVTDALAIPRVIAEVKSQIGPIDVLVNNAGYGYKGLVEETPLDDIRHQFDVNVFGAAGGKFALEGMSETFDKEVKGFGIGVTAVEPGMFRTDWAGRSMLRAPRKIADYDALLEPIRAARQAELNRWEAISSSTDFDRN